MRKTTFIYALIDPRYETVRYIGKSNNPESRYQNHYNKSRDKNTHKRNWINNIRKDNLRPEILILDEVDINDWIFWEKFYISLYKSWGFRLTNYTEGGDGATFRNSTTFKKCHTMNKGIPRSDETKRKISETLKRKSIKPPNRRKIIQYDLNYNKIKEYDSISDACKNSKFNKSKISAVCRFKRQSHGGYIWRYYDNNKKIKYINQKSPIIQYDKNLNKINEYDSISDACKDNKGARSANISACCNGTLKTYKGYIWRYKNKNDKKMKNKIILVGAGGSGKDYLATYLSKYLKKNVSYTTRPMREGEINGKDYHFISIDEFENKINEGYWHEYNMFIPEKKWFYGSSKENFNNCQLFIKEPYGVSQLTKQERKNSLIVYLNIDEDTRRERMSKRKNNADKIERRIESDKKDFENFMDFDIEIKDPNFDIEKLYQEVRNEIYRI